MGIGSRTVGRFKVRLFCGSKQACPKPRSLLVPCTPRFNKKSIRRYGGKCTRSPGEAKEKNTTLHIVHSLAGGFRPVICPFGKCHQAFGYSSEGSVINQAAAFTTHVSSLICLLCGDLAESRVKGQGTPVGRSLGVCCSHLLS